MKVGSIRTGLKRVLPAALVAGALALAPATNADPVSGGKTVLKPDADTFEALADMSIGVETTGAAKDGKNGLSFPITGGDVKEGPKGEIDHKGGIAFFTEGGGSVKFSKFAVKIGKNKTKVFAKSDKATVRFFDLDLSDATISGSAGTNLKIKGAEATLAKQGAQVMSDVFNFPFKKGIPLGSVTVKASIG
jgi:Htaa